MNLTVNFLFDLLASLLVGVFTGLFTARLAIRQFREEQWWSRKAENYIAMLTVLHEMKRFLRASLENQVGNAAQGEERLEELGIGWEKGEDQLAKAIDMGSFLFSSMALKRLEELQRGLAEASVNDFSWENVPNRIELLDRCLAELRTISRVDLQVR